MSTPEEFVYILMHLPKTGGTTINAHLSEHLGFDDGFAHFGPWGNLARESRGMPRPHDWPQARLDRLKAMSGHLVHATMHALTPEKTPRYFTFIRKPAALAVSQYNHDASRTDDPPTFWDWFDSRPRDPQLKGFEHRLGAVGLHEVRERLEAFWFVGPTEELDIDLPRIFETIGVPLAYSNRRVAGAGEDLSGIWPPIEDGPITRHQELNDEIAERVTAADAQDALLHQFAVHSAAKRRTEYGWTERPGS